MKLKSSHRDTNRLRSQLKHRLFMIPAQMSGNRAGQVLLEKMATLSHYLMGIGSGSDPYFSGESSLIRKVHQRARMERRAPRVLDVGANVGQFAVLVVNLLGPEPFELHSFEPGAAAFRSLHEVFKDDSRIILNNCGLGKTRGEMTLFYSAEGSPTASLTKRRVAHLGIEFSFSEKVQIDTLDGYCQSHQIDHIDLLKIDAEGHEMDVLGGAGEMLSRSSVEIVTFEFGGCNIDTRTYFQDFWYFLTDQRMKIARLTPSGYWQHIERYEEIHEQFRTTNFVAWRD